jgi:NTE family protein
MRLPTRMARSLLLVLFLTACSTPSPVISPPGPAPLAVAPPVPKIALALGGGAARGFAHIGVIKALEAQGIVPDFIVGTSAGSLVGALYAGGASGFDLQRMALAMDDAIMTDWSLFGRGLIKGEALQEFVNAALTNRPIEKLPRSLAIVSTDLQSGEPMVFRSGNTGMAVRASSSVPGIFQPARINGRDYVDGGLVAPVPVRIARSLGADIVIAVDISAQPREQKTASSFEMLLQTFAIMGQSILAHELKQADVVVRPNIGRISGTDFQSKHLAILEGERAAQAQVAAIKAKLAALSAVAR